MTGDEKPYPQLSRAVVRSVLGDELDDDLPLAVVVDEAQRMLEPFFLIPDLERRRQCERAWRDVLGDRVICMESPRDTTACVAGIVAMNEGAVANLDDFARKLEARGASRARVGAVVRALTPWAASAGLDGAPAPLLERHVPL
jgi:hypothetical protein